MSTCFYFTHIVKTGGQSIREFFHTKNIPMDFYAHDGSGHNSFSEDTLKKLKEKYDSVKTGICLRDPVKQLSSFYSYAQIIPSSGINKTVVGKSFSEWIRSVPNFENYYIRFLNFKEYYDPNSIDNLNGTVCDLDKAISILDSMDYVMDTKKLSKNMTEMLKENGIDQDFNIVKNVSYSKKVKISNKDISYIKDIRSEDYKLLEKYNITIEY